MCIFKWGLQRSNNISNNQDKVGVLGGKQKYFRHSLYCKGWFKASCKISHTFFPNQLALQIMRCMGPIVVTLNKFRLKEEVDSSQSSLHLYYAGYQRRDQAHSKLKIHKLIFKISSLKLYVLTYLTTSFFECNFQFLIFWESCKTMS